MRRLGLILFLALAGSSAAFAQIGVSRVYLQFLDLSDLVQLAELGELNGLVGGL